MSALIDTYLQKAVPAIAAGFIGITAACVAPPSNSGGNANSNANAAPSATASASPSPTPDTANVQFTLPLLNALLSDKEFLEEARSKIGLTDEEVQRLTDAADKAMSELSEDGDDDSRSARSANEQARAKIKAVLGEQRTGQLIALAQKYAGEVETATSGKPGSVPSDTRVVVNAPEFRMDVFKDGKLTKSYKIGIGYPEFPLPTGTRKASTIIFNPTWTPPDEPWVKGKIKPGEKIEAGDKLNPLGPIKIPIGLPSLIHGGKSPARLGTFASHGCVGLTNPQIQDFAMVLSGLGGQEMTLEDIKLHEKNKTETKEVKLATPVTVELRYETIVVEDGTLKIFRDVYEKGTNTEENLRKVLQAYGVELDSLSADLKQKLLSAVEQMATDASGKPADPATAAGNSNTAPSNAKDKLDPRSNSNSDSGKVTRNIKGKKLVEIKIPELAGKGYPAPVGMKA